MSLLVHFTVAPFRTVIFAGLKEEFSMLTAGVALFVASVEFLVFDEQAVNKTAKKVSGMR